MLLSTWRLRSGLAAALVLAACHQADAPVPAAASSNDVKMGTYRVVLKTPGGELPFGLELKEQDSHPVGYLINGPERLLLSDVKISGSHLEISMPGYQNVNFIDDAGAPEVAIGEFSQANDAVSGTILTTTGELLAERT